MALNMQTTIIVYWVYHITKDVASVGLLGLFEAIPAIGCSLFSGHFVDQREKRGLIATCVIAYVGLAVYFTSLAFNEGYFTGNKLPIVPFIYAGVFIGGVLRAFVSPATFG